MPAINSIEDLKRLREEALEKRKVKTTAGNAQIVVGMGTCGIAAGARDTMKAILREIETQQISGIQVTQTGCIGLCEREPIVMVTVGEGPRLTYGKVTPAVALRILKEHVQEGRPVSEHQIDM